MGKDENPMVPINPAKGKIKNFKKYAGLFLIMNTVLIGSTSLILVNSKKEEDGHNIFKNRVVYEMKEYYLDNLGNVDNPSPNTLLGEEEYTEFTFATDWMKNEDGTYKRHKFISKMEGADLALFEAFRRNELTDMNEMNFTEQYYEVETSEEKPDKLDTATFAISMVKKGENYQLEPISLEQAWPNLIALASIIVISTCASLGLSYSLYLSNKETDEIVEKVKKL